MLPRGVRTSLPRTAWLFVLAVVAVATVVVALYAPAAVRHLADGGWRAAWQPLLYVAGLVLAGDPGAVVARLWALADAGASWCVLAPVGGPGAEARALLAEAAGLPGRTGNS